MELKNVQAIAYSIAAFFFKIQNFKLSSPPLCSGVWMLKHPHLWRLLTLALRNVLLNQIKIIMFLNNLVCRKLVQRTNFFTTSYLYLWCNFVKRNIFQILRSVYDFGPAIIRLGRHTCTYNDIWWKRLLFEGAFKESKQQFPLTNHVCHQICQYWMILRNTSLCHMYFCMFVCFHVQFISGSCLPQSLHVATNLW